MSEEELDTVLSDLRALAIDWDEDAEESGILTEAARAIEKLQSELSIANGELERQDETVIKQAQDIEELDLRVENLETELRYVPSSELVEELESRIENAQLTLRVFDFARPMKSLAAIEAALDD